MLRRLSGVILMCSLNPLMAASTLDFQLQHGELINKQTTYINEGKLLVKAIGGDSNQDLLYDQNQNSLNLINHANKSYTRFNEQTIAALANQASGILSVLEAQLSNMPPDEAEQLRKILGINQESQTDKSGQPIRLEPSQAKTISGYPCQQTEVFRGQSPIASVCVVPNPATLNIPSQDYTVLRSLQTTGEVIAQSAGEIVQKFGATIPEYGFSKLDGMPIEVINLAENIPSRLTLISIQPGIGSMTIDIPDGYTAQAMPGL